MSSSNQVRLFDKKYLLLLTASLLFTFAFYRMIWTENPALAFDHWFFNDTRIEEILRENVETNFTYVKIYEPSYVPSFEGETTPFFGEYDIWFRIIKFYPLDPDTTLDENNFRLEGVIFIDGRIRIYGLMPADWYYV